mmetsp:Transcript_48228/g.134925  ORF Transcript_48228/g.134925 Transcript_48228/m.134925 type:complete len:139 (-) Transcript_48228:395-811(-)
MPITFSGRLEPLAMSRIGMAEVLVAKTQCSGMCSSTCAMTLCLRLRSSNTASMTMSAPSNNRPKNKEEKKVNAVKQEAVLAAAAKGDKAALKAAYADYIKTASLPNPVYKGRDADYSQGYSNDYDWKARTNRGTIYVR